MVLKIEKEVREIPQEVGVRQGDNMALVLFLFLMTAFAETLDLEWKCEKIKVVTAMIAADDEIQKGQLCSHTPKCSAPRSSAPTKYSNVCMWTTVPSLSTQGKASHEA